MKRRFNIGIRFCGGCNPRYDRTKVYIDLKTMFPEVTFTTDLAEARENGEQVDEILVICGCSAACANTDDLAGNYRIIRNQKEADDYRYEISRRMQDELGRIL